MLSVISIIVFVFVWIVSVYQIVLIISVFKDIEDILKVEEEESCAFIKETLEKLGIPLENIWKDDILSVEQKVLLRDLLSKFSIEVIDNGDKVITIYHEQELIAKWYKPKTILRRNEVVINPNKRFYYEVKFSFESLFENKES